ncbi:MAG: response regulator, partial [Polaromonas sp.]|nr:response regulator [Gemmatimonadaceae bacterium]
MEPSARLGLTILLVEDNEDNRIIYTTVLRHVGYDVIEAHDGVQAIALA